MVFGDFCALFRFLILAPLRHPPVDLSQKLNEDKLFSKSDFSKGYWQVTILEVDIPNTAFVTSNGSYEFFKMAFGMVNSAATLKRGMRKLLKDMENVEFYWDDILVHTRTWEEHLRILRELFSRLAQTGMTMRPWERGWDYAIITWRGEARAWKWVKLAQNLDITPSH